MKPMMDAFADTNATIKVEQHRKPTFSSMGRSENIRSCKNGGHWFLHLHTKQAWCSNVIWMRLRVCRESLAQTDSCQLHCTDPLTASLKSSNTGPKARHDNGLLLMLGAIDAATLLHVKRTPETLWASLKSGIMQLDQNRVTQVG